MYFSGKISGVAVEQKAQVEYENVIGWEKGNNKKIFQFMNAESKMWNSDYSII